MVRGSKTDLMNLHIDFSSRVSPKRKEKRALERQIVKMCKSLYGFHLEQRVLMLLIGALLLAAANGPEEAHLSPGAPLWALA